MARKKQESLAGELLIAVGGLIRRIRSLAPPETHGLTWTQQSVLWRLEKDGPATIAALARAESLKPQSMGTAVAGLEALGLVERKAHPTDGRQVNIRLTAKGSSLRRTAKDAKQDWLAQAIAELGKRDQAALGAACGAIQRLAESGAEPRLR
jgi:DNA-binding MarR family transcriptional regulator